MPKPFPKGNKLAGSRKGIPNKKTQQWEELGEYICKEGSKRYMTMLATLEDKEFAERFERVLEYFKPKLSRAAHTDGEGNALFPKPIMDVPQNYSNKKNNEPLKEA